MSPPELPWLAIIFLVQSYLVPIPVYQTQINRPIIPNQMYWIKFIQPTLPNYFGQSQSWSLVLEISKTKCTKPNLFNQTNSINPNGEKPNLQIIKVKSNPSLSWAWPRSVPACFYYLLIFMLGSIHVLCQHVPPFPPNWLIHERKPTCLMTVYYIVLKSQTCFQIR